MKKAENFQGFTFIFQILKEFWFSEVELITGAGKTLSRSSPGAGGDAAADSGFDSVGSGTAVVAAECAAASALRCSSGAAAAAEAEEPPRRSTKPRASAPPSPLPRLGGRNRSRSRDDESPLLLSSCSRRSGRERRRNPF